MVFENRVLRRIFGPKRVEEAGGRIIKGELEVDDDDVYRKTKTNISIIFLCK
jgi:hypothetical protein